MYQTIIALKILLYIFPHLMAIINILRYSIAAAEIEQQEEVQASTRTDSDQERDATSVTRPPLRKQSLWN